MKRKNPVRVLIYAAPALALALASVRAAPDTAPKHIEHHVDVRTGGAASRAPAGPVTFLGLEVAPVDETLAAQLKLPAEHGLVVRFVVPDSPAAAAGLQRHDVLTKLDDQVLIAPRQLSALVRSRKSGDTVRLTYVRTGTEARASATLTEREAPAVAGDTLHWIGGDAPHAFAVPAVRQFVYRGDAAAAGPSTGEDHLIGVPALPGGAPHVMVFRPQARVVYREGDVTLEVTTNEAGRRLEARGADGRVLFEGPIDTPEQRSTVPSDLQKHLEKLDALEPAPFHRALPAPAPMPLPQTGTLSLDGRVPDQAGAGSAAERLDIRVTTADAGPAI